MLFFSSSFLSRSQSLQSLYLFRICFYAQANVRAWVLCIEFERMAMHFSTFDAPSSCISCYQAHLLVIRKRPGNSCNKLTVCISCCDAKQCRSYWMLMEFVVVKMCSSGIWFHQFSSEVWTERNDMVIEWKQKKGRTSRSNTDKYMRYDFQFHVHSFISPKFCWIFAMSPFNWFLYAIICLYHLLFDCISKTKICSPFEDFFLNVILFYAWNFDFGHCSTSSKCIQAKSS